MQCQSIFGPDAREAPHPCYEAVNTIGDQYGNCAVTGTNTYMACSKQHVMCGNIQCVNIKKLPDLPDHTIIISTHLHKQNLMCWGIGYHLATESVNIPNFAFIGDGTSCGKNLVCINRTCVKKSSVIRYDCAINKCNRRGFCNNLKNCHCMYGWAPPFCEKPGRGGSINSGTPGIPVKEPEPNIRIVSIIVIRLILLVVSAVLVYLWGILERALAKKENPTPKTEAGKTPKQKSRETKKH
ncbi:Disintegrin and metalloproteinase domain-containing protein 30 [Galemys pyrenaicus]|uniref:Disintegrin and metalloproteinase domain-containing protein 30 n=1 Tax=Galemys pyrenaicus TaxID=202257 RepID=A0A8J6AQH0_GALPY|nr:Disintegrin and metalloproteinase domain-containing protein 30 [Galemys pyrenaicus]